jgi:hypothetical protein
MVCHASVAQNACPEEIQHARESKKSRIPTSKLFKKILWRVVFIEVECDQSTTEPRIKTCTPQKMHSNLNYVNPQADLRLFRLPTMLPVVEFYHENAGSKWKFASQPKASRSADPKKARYVRREIADAEQRGKDHCERYKHAAGEEHSLAYRLYHFAIS